MLLVPDAGVAARDREFREETGLSINITGLLRIYSDPATSRHTYPDGQEVQFVGVVFEGEVDGSPPATESDEITAVEHSAPDDLPEPLFAPSRVVIEDARSSHPRPFSVTARPHRTEPG